MWGRDPIHLLVYLLVAVVLVVLILKVAAAV